VLSIKRRTGDVVEIRTASIFGRPIVTVVRARDLETEPAKNTRFGVGWSLMIRPFSIWSIPKDLVIEKQGGSIMQFLEKQGRVSWIYERRHFFGITPLLIL
jgi:hypothetical protein